MLFIINPLNAQIVFWTSQLNYITRIMISDEELIICHKNESNNLDASANNSNEDNEDSLFTLIKVYDIDDFIDNEDYILNLSNLSLFCFLNENLSVIAILLKENLNLRDYINDEWTKLGEGMKSKFNSVKNLIDNKADDKQIADHSQSTIDTESVITISLEQSISLVNGNSVLSNGNVSSTSIKKDEFTNETAVNDKLNGKDELSNQINRTLQQQIINGKKSIDELTSKHRWKKSNEPVDEKKVLRKRLNRLKQNLDKMQIMKLKCKCNYPAPRAHQMMNSKQKEIRLILIKLLDDSNLDEILEACFQYAIWNLYLDLLILKRNYIDYIKLALTLMDINLLAKNNLLIAILKSDLNLSRQLFDLFVKQKNLTIKSVESPSKSIASESIRPAICFKL